MHVCISLSIVKLIVPAILNFPILLLFFFFFFKLHYYYYLFIYLKYTFIPVEATSITRENISRHEPGPFSCSHRLSKAARSFALRLGPSSNLRFVQNLMMGVEAAVGARGGIIKEIKGLLN